MKRSRSKIERLNSLEKITDRNNIVDFRSTKIVLYYWELRKNQEEIEKYKSTYCEFITRRIQVFYDYDAIKKLEFSSNKF